MRLPRARALCTGPSRKPRTIQTPIESRAALHAPAASRSAHWLNDIHGIPSMALAARQELVRAVKAHANVNTRSTAAGHGITTNCGRHKPKKLRHATRETVTAKPYCRNRAAQLGVTPGAPSSPPRFEGSNQPCVSGGQRGYYRPHGNPQRTRSSITFPETTDQSAEHLPALDGIGTPCHCDGRRKGCTYARIGQQQSPHRDNQRISGSSPRHTALARDSIWIHRQCARRSSEVACRSGRLQSQIAPLRPQQSRRRALTCPIREYPPEQPHQIQIAGPR